MDCNIAEKFDFVSSLAAQPLAALLRGKVSIPAAPVPGFNPTLMVHQPYWKPYFQKCGHLVSGRKKPFRPLLG